MEVEVRENELKVKKICRFCLCQHAEQLDSIFKSGKLGDKATAPLPMQVMACASIEVFMDDGMPSWVCHECRLLFEHGYRFKQMCKRAETLLKQYPLTGTWPNALTKPRIPLALIAKQVPSVGAKLNANNKVAKTLPPPAPSPSPSPSTTSSILMATQKPITKATALSSISQTTSVPSTPGVAATTANSHSASATKMTVMQTYGRKLPAKSASSNTLPISTDNIVATTAVKILNANPVASPEPPAPMRIKREKLEEEKTSQATKTVAKTENDINANVAGETFVNEIKGIIDTLEKRNTIEKVLIKTTLPIEAIKKPRLLNKSSIRILNKEADVALEPRIREPQVKCDKDGNVAIVTEIMDPNEPYDVEPDPVTTAVPVETNVFPCPHCERSFPLHQLRDIHLAKHNRTRGFPCSDCGRSFFSKYDLQKHSVVHSGDRPYKCRVCNRGFTRSTLLHRHEKSHTDMPKFLCVYCEKTFLSKEELEKHTENHLKNRPFQCKICSKSFAFKQGLERHEVIHSRDQPYPCQYCKESFSTASKLARHLTAHAGKRPYPCKFCSKSYLLSHHLTRHLRSHTQGLVTFHCGECSMEFKTRDALITHSVTHGADTLCCPLCKEQFTNKSQVDEHIKAHAEGDIFACEFCDMIFIFAEQLHEHIDADHVEDMRVYREDDQNQSKIRNSVSTLADLQRTLDEVLIDDGISSNKINILNDETITPAEPTLTVTQSDTANNDNVKSSKMSNSSKKRTQNVMKAEEPPLQEPPLKIQKLQESITKSIDAPVATTQRRRVPKVPNPSIVQLKKTNEKRNSSTFQLSPVTATKANVIPKTTPTTTTATVVNTHNANANNIDANNKGRRSSNSKLDLKKSAGANKMEEIDDKTMKTAVQGDNKTKIVTIKMSRAEAEAMAKDGRIRIKDGNMYLNKKLK